MCNISTAKLKHADTVAVDYRLSFKDGKLYITEWHGNIPVLKDVTEEIMNLICQNLDARGY